MRETASKVVHLSDAKELARDVDVENGIDRIMNKRAFAPSAGVVLFLLSLSIAADDLESPQREALSAAYYELEVAGYCGLVTEAVGAGFRRRVARIVGDAHVDKTTLDRLRGEAWQAAHAEWQNRGLGGFRAWCRNEGRAAAEGFLAEPH